MTNLCPRQKILSEAKMTFFIQLITNDELFIHVQNFWFRTKNILSEKILILSRTKIILSGQMDWALVNKCVVKEIGLKRERNTLHVCIQRQTNK